MQPGAVAWFDSEMRLALLGLLIVAGCSGRPQCPTIPATRATEPFLWRVSGPLGSLTIQATHQGVGGDAVSQSAWSALDGTSLYVTEANEATEHTPADPSRPSPMFELDGISLEQLLPATDFRELQRRTNVDPNELRRMKPWVAFVLLGRSQVSFPDRSMNRELLDRARRHGAHIVFLESWDDQMRYLDAAITPAKLSRAIRGASTMQCDLERRIAAFRAGDDAVFANDITPDEPIVTRTEGWYARLRHVVDGQRAFVAIGIGQLLGPYGLLARFARDGYQVLRLSGTPAR